MPFLKWDEIGMRGRVLLAFVVLALGWLALQTGVFHAVLALGLTSPTVAGLLVLAVLAYWALDELEDEDEATDVISKTSERAESASKGLLDGTAALIMGIGTVGLTVGVELFDGVLALIDMAMTLPLASAQIGTGIAGLAGAVGLLAVSEVALVALVLLVAGLAARRHRMEG